MDALAGIAEADALLGRRMPLPRAALPLTRWVEVVAVAEHAVEVSWNLDDSRADAPGRVALYAGEEPAVPHELAGATEPVAIGHGLTHREAPLPQAQASLQPVHELLWQHDGLHLRLTAQGPWVLDALVAIARSVV
jgi:hypothetical protein